MAAAAVVGVAGGWWLSDRDGPSDRLGSPGADTVPTDGIPVATDVTGQPLPAVEAETLDGATVALASLADRPLVLNFWFSTCLPCRKEMPDFEEVHQAVGDRVRIVGVNPARQPGARTGLRCPRSGPPTSCFAIRTGGSRLRSAWRATPTTVFVSAAGTILATTAGELSAAELRDRIEELYPS